MNRKAVALIITLSILIVFFVLGQTFFIKTMNEHNNVKRHLISARSFWAAEAGVAQALSSLKACVDSLGDDDDGHADDDDGHDGHTKNFLPSLFDISAYADDGHDDGHGDGHDDGHGDGHDDGHGGGGSSCTTNGTITYTDYPEGSYSYSFTITSLGSDKYKLESTGSQGGISRKVVNVVSASLPTSSSRFPYSIEAKGGISLQGSASITPDPTENPETWNPNSGNWSSPPVGSDYFEYLFGYTKTQMKAYADNIYTDPPNNVTPVDDITWIDVSPGSTFKITSSKWSGSGILIVNGDARITGGDFDGIIYIIGNLDVPAGNPQINGTIIVENDNSETVDLRGNFSLTYSSSEVGNALNNLKYVAPSLAAWWEESP